MTCDDFDEDYITCVAKPDPAIPGSCFRKSVSLALLLKEVTSKANHFGGVIALCSPQLLAGDPEQIVFNLSLMDTPELVSATCAQVPFVNALAAGRYRVRAVVDISASATIQINSGNLGTIATVTGTGEQVLQAWITETASLDFFEVDVIGGVGATVRNAILIIEKINEDPDLAGVQLSMGGVVYPSGGIQVLPVSGVNWGPSSWRSGDFVNIVRDGKYQLTCDVNLDTTLATGLATVLIRRVSDSFDVAAQSAIVDPSYDWLLSMTGVIEATAGDQFKIEVQQASAFDISYTGRFFTACRTGP